MKVLAFPQESLFREECWRSYISTKISRSSRPYGVRLEYYDHRMLSDFTHLIQQVAFVMFYPHSEDRFRYYLFVLPDGKKSLGVPVHIAAPNTFFPTGSLVGSFGVTGSRVYSKAITIHFPKAYRESINLNGERFPLKSLHVDRYEDLQLPYYTFLTGPFNNHAVYVLQLPSYHIFSSDNAEITNFLTPIEFLQLGNRSLFSERVARRLDWDEYLCEREFHLI